MAPRPPESREQFLARLERLIDAGASVVPFGQHHRTHAACLDDGVWTIRRLEVSEGARDAFFAEHGRFMPEDAERISKPGELLREVGSREALFDWVRSVDWPVNPGTLGR